MSFFCREALFLEVDSVACGASGLEHGEEAIADGSNVSTAPVSSDRRHQLLREGLVQVSEGKNRKTTIFNSFPSGIRSWTCSSMLITPTW